MGGVFPGIVGGAGVEHAGPHLGLLLENAENLIAQGAVAGDVFFQMVEIDRGAHGVSSDGRFTLGAAILEAG